MSTSAFDLIWEYLSFNDIRAESTDCNHHCIICKRVMINAFVSNCECHYCKSCLEAHLQKGLKGCPGNKENCLTESLNLNVFTDNSSNIAILKLITKCPNAECDVTVEYGKMEEHLRVCEVQMNECPYSRFGCDKNAKEKVSIHMELQDVHHAKLLIEEIDNLRNELNLVKNELRDAKVEIEKIKKENKDKREKGQKNYQRDNSRRPNTDSIPNNSVENNNQQGFNTESITGSIKEDRIGENTWTLPNYSTTVDKYIGNPSSWIYSPSFWSHNGGYKLNLVINPQGTRRGSGTHLYVGFCLWKGQYDDELSWPFKGIISVSIVDQLSGQNKFLVNFNCDNIPNNRRHCLDKPTGKHNPHHGNDKCIELTSLRADNGLLYDNCLKLKCQVTC